MCAAVIQLASKRGPTCVIGMTLAILTAFEYTYLRGSWFIIKVKDLYSSVFKYSMIVLDIHAFTTRIYLLNIIVAYFCMYCDINVVFYVIHISYKSILYVLLNPINIFLKFVRQL